MLRGDLVNARKKFLKAYEREPNKPTIANNLQLLNSSSRFIQRAPANKNRIACSASLSHVCW